MSQVEINMTTIYDVKHLGALGDGVADGPIYIARSLPGEQVTGVPSHARIDDPKILAPSPDRVTPPCRAFKTCGGCAVQHASDAFVASWKENRLRQLLGDLVPQEAYLPITTSAPLSRRRASFAARRTKKGTLVGFHGAKSDQIIDAAPCQTVSEAILNALPSLHELTKCICSRKERLNLSVTDCDNGLDLDVRAEFEPSQERMIELLSWFTSSGFLRLSWNKQTLAQQAQPLVQMGTANVPVPPGSFLQATRHGQAALADFVVSHLSDHKRIGDLFAGSGTLTLPLAATSEVVAVEAEQVMLDALELGWRHSFGLRRVATQRRDLFNNPLLPAELEKFDAICLDPPRAGAHRQVLELAQSNVTSIAYVSCSPESFARDLEHLVASGYICVSLLPVDQFRWSAHSELAVFLQK